MEINLSSIISQISEIVYNLLERVINLLPDSPFYFLQVNGDVYTVLQYVNWIIPINFMISTLETWLTCVTVYYVWSLVLRWIKAID